MTSSPEPLPLHLRQGIFLFAFLFCLAPFISAGIALLIGVAVALSLGNPFQAQSQAWTHRFLSLAVIGLGAGMNLETVARVGLHGIGYTLFTIALAFTVGLFLGRVFKTERDTSMLITTGTAICGGSAIAAVSPVLRAKPHEVSVALGIVFTLNALALFLFPPIGHALDLSETQFGLWAALAIHDTSSVVGASLAYGPHALEVGTTVKLARALWIVPLTFLIGVIVARRKGGDRAAAGPAKPKRPWFILGFLAMAALVTWIPELRGAGHVVESIAKRLLILTLFLIGSNLTKATFKAVGFRPYLQGLALWLFMASTTLFLIVEGWIQ